MRIVYSNLIPDATLAASSERSGYSIENVRTWNLAQKFAFNGNSGNIVIDLAGATLVKALCIGGHNLSAAATVTLQGNASDSWGSPSYSQAVTIRAGALVLYLSATYRYWRLVVSDASLSYVEIGNLCLASAYLQMPGVDPQFAEEFATTSAAVISLSGQVQGDIGYQAVKIEYTFRNMTVATRTVSGKTVSAFADILAWWKACENHRPYYLDSFEESTLMDVLVGITDMQSFKPKWNAKHTAFDQVQFVFRETK